MTNTLPAKHVRLTKITNNTADFNCAKLLNNSIETSKFPTEALDVAECADLIQWKSL